VLPLVAEAIVSLLSPFTWNYLYIPLLPLSMFQYLECPTPFLMGIHSSYYANACALVDPDTLFVHLDCDEVVSLAPPSLPFMFKTRLVKRARELYSPDCGALRHPSNAPSPVVPGDADALFRLELTKMWAFVLCGWKDFCVFLPDHLEPSIIFDVPAFIKAKTAREQEQGEDHSDEAREELETFLTTLLRTSYFPLFLERRSDRGNANGLRSTLPEKLDQLEHELFAHHTAPRHLSVPAPSLPTKSAECSAADLLRADDLIAQQISAWSEDDNSHRLSL
jgi:hypothetical protein